MAELPTLNQAVRAILRHCPPGRTEVLELAEALGRILAAPLRAASATPPFAQASRDGYTFRSRNLGDALPATLRIAGEIAAGCRELPSCGRGEALRIMTGAPLPPGCERIIPLEQALLRDNRLEIRELPQETFIRRRGCDLAKNSRIAQAGTELAPEHLALAAGTGATQATVYQRPEVAVLCTGSELLSSGENRGSGQIFSANLLLLQGLISENGGQPASLQTAPDQLETIVTRLAELLAARVPLILTTGGTGPGSYDLMARAFAELGLKTLCGGLAVKPGHHTRAGWKEGTLLLALPGPPPAARLLFNQLARPVLYRLTGRQAPQTMQAELSEDLASKGRPIANLKGGVYSLRSGKVVVRLADRREPCNCVLLLPAGKRFWVAGETLTIHPTR